MNSAIQNDLNAKKEQELKEMQELQRIINNNLALLESNDVLIPVSHARAIPEIIAWLKFTLDQVAAKLADLKPKSDSASVGTEQDKQVIDAEVVSEPAKV